MAEQRLEEIRRIRLERRKHFLESGTPPYPSKLSKKPIPIKEAREKNGKHVIVAGRIMSWREHGNIVFADLKDQTSSIQLFFQKKSLSEKFKQLKKIDIGDFLLAEGKIFTTDAGETTVEVLDYQLLSKSIRPLPSTWHGLRDIEDRYRQRYVDLVLNPEVREVFEKKSEVMKLLRSFLDSQGFVEAVTPALQPLYGGATARPFTTHHNALDSDLFLRISDELYLKRLVVGGFEKVYEMCTDFRNEGIDRWHNPEFTMLEFYWAYADYQDLMDLTESMLSSVVKDVTGSFKVKYGEIEVDFTPPWDRKTYKEALLESANVDIDEFETFEKLLSEIKSKNIKVDLKDAKDYPTLMDNLYKAAFRPNVSNPVFLTDHPYQMRPLAKRKLDNKKYAETFQLVAAGAELINAYSELNDPVDQRTRWKEDMKRGKEGAEEYQMIDEDYLRALEYGMPPTAGWGMGIDRFTALLTNQHSIKDTILFPTLKTEVVK